MVEIQSYRNDLSVNEVGDRVSVGQSLIVAGARLKDGPMIKVGINHLKTVG